MRLLYCFLIKIVLIKFSHEKKIFDNCRFVKKFYQAHSNIFELDNNQTFLTVRPLYALSNQSLSSLSIGIIYRLADTYLVPVPLLFQCLQSEHIYAPVDCEFTIIDTHSDLSIRSIESTRTSTVVLNFQEYTSIRGAYFKESTIALRNCRLNSNENIFTSQIFYINIQFEQKINSPCQHTCIHPQLYECSSISNTCQCRSNHIAIEKFGQLCIDTELGSNCSLTSQRCRRICRLSDQIRIGKIDLNCQCPFGTQRILSNNMYHCQLPAISKCKNDKSIVTCILIRVNESILLIGLLIGALLIIIILICSLIKMRSIKCVKFIHEEVLTNNSSPTTITRLSSLSSSNSTNKICEKYTKINFLE